MIRIVYEESEKKAAAYDGDDKIGECSCIEKDGCRHIVHTEVDPAYGGRGIASQLVQCLAEEAEKRGVPVVPVCSYAARWFEKHRGSEKNG